MTRSKGTVAIIGSGAVGSSTAFALILRESCERIILYDAFPKISRGKFLDLSPATWAFGKKVEVGFSENFPDKADIFVITAGLPRKAGMTRKDLLGENEGIVLPILEKLKNSGAIVLLVTNPVDLLVKAGVEKVGFPEKLLVGISSLLDSVRLSDTLGKGAVVLGPHNEKLVALGAGEGDESAVRWRGAEIISLLSSSAQYSPGAVIAKTVELVLSGNQEKEIIPCSVYLRDWNGFSKIAFGVPVLLGKGGIEGFPEIEFTGPEIEKLMEGARSLEG